MHYTTYTAEDFVQDPYFRRWVKNPDQACEAFWQQFMSEYPEKIPALEEAREILVFLLYDEIEPSIEEQEEVKSRILQGIAAAHPAQPLLAWKRYYRAAAIFTGIALYTLLFTLLKSSFAATVVRTQYAQTREVVLPDGSSAILNANSALRFSNDWAKTHTREVWLEGEAFFEVRKKPEWANARFTVHTDGLYVEVLGTTFNVNARRGKVKVVLNTGKVKLKPKGSSDTLTMHPEDLVEFSTASKAFIKKRVNPKSTLPGVPIHLSLMKAPCRK
jgi:ferric-dicitrate binding protein FerR (iron transport regulator)